MAGQFAIKPVCSSEHRGMALGKRKNGLAGKSVGLGDTEVGEGIGRKVEERNEPLVPLRLVRAGGPFDD